VSDHGHQVGGQAQGGRDSGPTVCPPSHRGLFKTDRVLGTAQLKLDALETACEVREILEVRGGQWPDGQLCTPLCPSPAPGAPDLLPLSPVTSPQSRLWAAPPQQCSRLILSQVLDGRRPTGGRLEVMVRIREPLTAQQLETTTERWLVIDPMPTVSALPVHSTREGGSILEPWRLWATSLP
jgi:hypothetical protein